MATEDRRRKRRGDEDEEGVTEESALRRRAPKAKSKKITLGAVTVVSPDIVLKTDGTAEVPVEILDQEELEDRQEEETPFRHASPLRQEGGFVVKIFPSTLISVTGSPLLRPIGSDAFYVSMARSIVSLIYLLPGSQYPNYYPVYFDGNDADSESKLMKVRQYMSAFQSLVPYMTKTDRLGCLWDVTKPRNNVEFPRRSGHHIDVWTNTDGADRSTLAGQENRDKSIKGRRITLEPPVASNSDREPHRSVLAVEDCYKSDRENIPEWHPEFIINWMIMRDQPSLGPALSTTDGGWLSQVRVVFKIFDKILNEGKAVFLGCKECWMRSPSAIFLYLLYQGIPWTIANKITKDHSAQFYCARTKIKKKAAILTQGVGEDDVESLCTVAPNRLQLKQWNEQSINFRDVSERYFGLFNPETYVDIKTKVEDGYEYECSHCEEGIANNELARCKLCKIHFCGQSCFDQANHVIECEFKKPYPKPTMTISNWTYEEWAQKLINILGSKEEAIKKAREKPAETEEEKGFWWWVIRELRTKY